MAERATMATEELSPGSREASIASPLPALVDPASVQAGDALLYKYRTGGFSATTVCTKSSYTHVGIVGPTEPAAADGRLAVYEMTKVSETDQQRVAPLAAACSGNGVYLPVESRPADLTRCDASRTGRGT